MATAFGLVLIFLPFLLVRIFQDKKKGLLALFTVVATFHLLVALVTQSLGVFNYWTVLSLHASFDILCLWHARKVVLRSGHSRPFTWLFRLPRKGMLKKSVSSWFPLGVALLALYLLLSLHYNFTGRVDTGAELKIVRGSSYSYPLYSDEWIGSALVRYSMQSGSLPIVNPLDANKPFPNFLFVSHSLIAEIMIILDMDPVSQYVQIGIANSYLILVLLYAIVRKIGIRPSVAAVSAFSALMLTNSGNLPGLWFLLPYSISLAFLLASVLSAFSSTRDWRVFYVLIGIALLLYPPIVIFAAPVVAASMSHFRHMYIKVGKRSVPEAALILILAAICSVLFTILFVIKGFTFASVVSKGFSYLIREPLDLGRVYYAPWNIIPMHLIPFVFVGLLASWRAKIKLLMYPLIVGVVMWVSYTLVDTVIVMEASRIVVITSILAMIPLGLGLEKAYAYARARTKSGTFDLEDPILNNGIKAIMLVFLLVWTVNVSAFGVWHRMPLHVKSAGNGMLAQVLIPAPPVTRYLSEDDLRLFAAYKGRRFISPSWKGLVVGVATQNYPLDSKPATITNMILSYEDFDSAKCDDKVALAVKHGISLVYGKSFSCSAFVEVGESSEGLHLYQFKKPKPSNGTTTVPKN